MTDPHQPVPDTPALPPSTDERTAGLPALSDAEAAVARIAGAVACPTCHAQQGDPCTTSRDGGGREPMADVHLRRYTLAGGHERTKPQPKAPPAADFHQAAGGTPMQFTGTCRHCGEPFQYEALGVSLGSERAFPVTGPKYVCPKVACQGEEARITGERERIEREQQEEELARRRREAFLRWVPDLYHVKARPGHAAHTSHIVPELRDWTPDQSLYLHGPAGSGKTHQVACLMLKVAGRRDLEWYSSRRLIADLLASYSSKRLERPAVFGAPCASPVLVLNDLFAERSTDHTVTELGNLIDARYEAGLPIVVTSNLSLSEAAAKFDARRSDAPIVAQELERITTRLLEMTAPPRGIRHLLDDTDWRTAIAMQAMQDAAQEPTT